MVVGQLLHLLILGHFLPQTVNMSMWETRQPVWDSMFDSCFYI